MILWPDALPRLRELKDHWRRRQNRIEYLAQGQRVNYETFPEGRAYIEGKADAFQEAVDVLEECRVTPIPLDLAIIQLVQQGVDVDAIAAATGCSVREVAEVLARLTRGEDTETDGPT